jgi:hypothetical protein
MVVAIAHIAHMFKEQLKQNTVKIFAIQNKPKDAFMH